MPVEERSIIEPEDSDEGCRDISVTGDPTREAPRALQDLRQYAMSLPPEQMTDAIAQYAERRSTFRELVLKMLKKGTHYGFPPGCEPKMEVREGGEVFFSNRGSWHSEKQWRPKESLYKAGADFLCDLMGVRDVYEADMDGWKQMGEKPGLFVYKCTLISRSTGEVVGEGRGARKNGQKGGDENNAIKMAKKAAKVDAVLNGYGLSDLFAQDIEDGDDVKPEHPKPKANKSAANAPPRTERVPNAKAKMVELMQLWRSGAEETDDNELRNAWVEFVTEATGREFNVLASAEWHASDFRAVSDKLGLPNDEDK